jgi:hypothetical protein
MPTGRPLRVRTSVSIQLIDFVIKIALTKAPAHRIWHKAEMIISAT